MEHGSLHKSICIFSFILSDLVGTCFCSLFWQQKMKPRRERRRGETKTVGWQTIPCLIWIYIMLFFSSSFFFPGSEREMERINYSILFHRWMNERIFCWKWEVERERETLQGRYNSSICNFKWHDIDWVELLKMQLSFCFGLNEIIVPSERNEEEKMTTKSNVCCVFWIERRTHPLAHSNEWNDVDLLFVVRAANA